MKVKAAFMEMSCSSWPARNIKFSLEHSRWSPKDRLAQLPSAVLVVQSHSSNKAKRRKARLAVTRISSLKEIECESVSLIQPAKPGPRTRAAFARDGVGARTKDVSPVRIGAPSLRRCCVAYAGVIKPWDLDFTGTIRAPEARHILSAGF